MKLSNVIGVLICVASLWMGSAQAQNLTLTYQGNLSDAGDQAVNGTRTITFALYSSADGGDALICAGA